MRERLGGGASGVGPGGRRKKLQTENEMSGGKGDAAAGLDERKSWVFLGLCACCFEICRCA